MKSLVRNIDPIKRRPHYRTRVIQNRRYIKLDGVRLFVIHWLVTLMYASAWKGAPMFCLGAGGMLLWLLLLAFVGILP